MGYLETTFKVVSSIFAIASIYTGAQAVVNPVGFSNSFGIPLVQSSQIHDTRKTSKTAALPSEQIASTRSYISLMGIRQLATGVTIATFAYQDKWSEIATILAIIGVLVACTDAWHLSSAGNTGAGRFHAIPGLSIAALAATKLYFET